MVTFMVSLKESGVFDKCEELRIINVCFADDLFLFSRGDVASATVVIDSLNEFKHVSGLILSIPKSTFFFCNVVNHVKLSILNVMPFLEGVLPVNYLGVPLISSRLLNKDCKVLVEKARNRIRDWKNKSLSFVGRLQLCNSVNSSMQVYWASVLAIPFGIIDDIQQLIRGFLWFNGKYKKGKAKVSWEDICLPKREGGLGIWCLKVFNIALMTTHIWNIVSNKESLWVRWIHMYKLKGHTLWDIRPKASMSWGWRKLLQLCDIVKPFFVETCGNGFHLHMYVADIITNGAWDWPQAWLLKAPNLGLIPVPVLNDTEDCIRWRDGNGNVTSFSVKCAWEALRPQGVEVPWYSIVWFSHCIPRHAFHMWLIMRRSLKTQDKLRSWDVGPDIDITQLRCSLCGLQMDSHEHTFFECSFSSKVWSLLRHLAGMERVAPVLEDIIAWLLPIGAKRSFNSVVGKLLFAAATYFIWSERNNRLFKNQRRTPEDIRDLVMVTVRLKSNKKSNETLVHHDPKASAKRRHDPSLKALDEGFSSKNYVRKFLRALHPKWRAKVTIIEESKDLSSLALDELIGTLKKESSDDETSTSGSDDEEYAMAIRNFKKRGDPNHLIGDCPKPTRNKDQKAFIGGSWSDSENDAEDKTNDETCLMAQSSNEVTLNSSCYSDDTSSLDNDTMRIEYDSLCEISLKIINKNKTLKAKRDLLEKEVLELNEKIKKLERSKEIDIACKSCQELKLENAKLKETQVKFVKFDKSANPKRNVK
ncbi:homeodomain-like protein [Tanacetum coccineum]